MQISGAAAPLSQAVPSLNTAGYTPAEAARLAKAKEAAQKFEASFLYQFMELSSPKPDKDSMFGGGFGEEMYRHQMNEQSADAMAKRGGLGLADHILSQMAQRGDIPPLHPTTAARQAYGTPAPAATSVQPLTNE